MKLLSTNNAKIVKGEKLGYMTAGLHLAPYNLSGKNVCSHASKGCAIACLNTSGMGIFKNVQAARIAKTQLFWENKEAFLLQLEKELVSFIKKCAKLNMIPAIRLNLTSDLPWENFGIMEKFPNVQFYDYSKVPNRFINKVLPKNYHLTFSRSESNEETAKLISSMGHNVAVVFAGKLPETFWGKPVVNGDETDLRFLDSKNSIVGLSIKGKAKYDETGFVVKAA